MPVSEFAHVRVVVEDATKTVPYVVLPDGRQYPVYGVIEATMRMPAGTSVRPTLELELALDSADISTLRKPGMK